MVSVPTPPSHENPQENEPHHHHHHHHHKRLCDFCGESKALLYCRADSAKLCFNCDKEVHSTNQLFTKHTRSQLCDSCDSNPATILCSTENLVLCQNCDWESHNGKMCLGSSSVHDRKAIDGFTGCPSGVELCGILGFEDDVVVGDKCGEDYLVDFDEGGDDGFSDLLVWDSIDDLIGSGGSTTTNDSTTQSFQAVGVPPLVKNRNTTCGKYKEEILSQLKDMVKLENCFINDNEDLGSLLEFLPLEPGCTIQTGMGGPGFQLHAEPIVFPVYEEKEKKWEVNSNEAAVQVSFSPAYAGGYAEQDSLVPDKSADVVDDGADANCVHDNQSSNLVIRETLPIPPKFVLHKSITQNRDSSISRYKEKKKTRRYDHHIRYESRKARAEGRSRIRGRFARIEN